MRFLLPFFILFLIIGCTVNEPPGVDLVIINSNIYYLNDDAAKTSQTLLDQQADVYVLVEATVGHNVDSALFTDNGYTLYDLHETGEPNSMNMVIATRIGGEYGEIFYPRRLAPSATLRIPFNDEYLTIVGIHTPPPHYSTVEEQRIAFEELRELGENGRAARTEGSMQEGDLLILAGDFNCFPTDPNMVHLTDMGLEDGAVYSSNPYQYTWGPHISPTKFARIDYLFASPEVPIQYQGIFSIDGSDHEAVKTGINYQ